MNRRTALGALFAAPLAAVAALKPKQTADDLYYQWIEQVHHAIGKHPFPSPAHELVVRAQQLHNEMERRMLEVMAADERRWNGSLKYVQVESYGR